MFLVIEKTHDGMNFVHLGPMPWRQRLFQSVITDDLEIDYTLPVSNDGNEAIIINDIARIIPVTNIDITEPFNPKIQQLIGPYYNFYETYAEHYQKVEDKPLDVVRSELKPIIAANRYRYEILGTSVTIQDKTLNVLTTREDRGLYLQAYQLGKDDVNWKFGDTFVILSNSDLGIIVNAVANHVQSAFDWESRKNIEIDSAITLEELDNIKLISDDPVWEPVVEQVDVGIK